MTVMVSKKRVSGNRKAKYKSVGEKCPFPGCNHRGRMITKVHCRTHGMERDELFKAFGEPELLEYNPVALKENMKKYVPAHGSGWTANVARGSKIGSPSRDSN